MSARSSLLALGLAVCLAACGDPSAPKPAPDVVADTPPSDAAADVTADDVPAAEVAPDSAADAPADVGPSPACVQACAPWSTCGAALAAGVCEASCDAPQTAKATAACLKSETDCDAFAACLELAAEKPAGVRTFDEGKPGLGYKDLAGDFTVPLADGDFVFSQAYDGTESFVFVFMGRGLYKTGDGTDYLDKLWYGATVSDLKTLLTWSPKSVHYFFVGYLDAGGKDDSQAHVEAMRAKVDKVLDVLPIKEQVHWRKHLHFAQVRAPRPQDPPGPQTLGGWLGDFTTAKLPAQVAIDRFQRVRQVGLLAVVGSPKPLLQHLAWEARSFDHEWQRALDHPEAGVDTVTLLEAKATGGETLDIELPPKEKMAQYDTLEIDLTQDCKDHDQKNCFEWDYKADLRVGERPVEAGNPDQGKACQPEVPEVKAKPEVPGKCEGGDQPCTTDQDCKGAKCLGYQAKVEAVAGKPADTLPCECWTPRQEKVARQKVCQWQTPPKDGQAGVSGFSACQCQAGPRIQRWITTYHREGRWITDATRALYYLNQGGKVRFLFNGAYPYLTTLKLRLMKKGKGGAPSLVVPLFEGGAFHATYNDKYQPKQVPIPKTAKRVELVLDVSGHGFGKDKANCAEFCNHTHHFTVQAAGASKTFVREQPYVGDNYGCAKQVDFGVVPNQFGTWTLGRGGWCPGYAVPVTTWDVTAEAKPGETATFSYQGMLAGKPYLPQPFDAQSGGFGAEIDMASWLLIYE